MSRQKFIKTDSFLISSRSQKDIPVKSSHPLHFTNEIRAPTLHPSTLKIGPFEIMVEEASESEPVKLVLKKNGDVYFVIR